MMKAGMVTLIQEAPRAHGVGEEPAETRRKVYCTAKSVGMQETYQSMAIGLRPEIKLVLAHDFEYKGEKRCEYQGERWKILRTYITEADGIELTLEREEGNARGQAETKGGVGNDG